MLCSKILTEVCCPERKATTSLGRFILLLLKFSSCSVLFLGMKILLVIG